MCKTRMFRLNAAAIFFFSFASAAALAGAQTPVLDDLLGTAGPAGLVDPGQAKVTPPAAVAPEQVRPGAPRPGKDFEPVIQDQMRIKAVMKLLADINSGAHLPYAQDGAVFSNKEGRLPVQPKGFYREYTLLTGSAPHTVTIGDKTYQVAPDLSARGSERVIIGGGEKIYYTPDHYANFILLTVVY